MESHCTARTPAPLVFLIPNPWAFLPTHAAKLRSFAIALLGAPGKGKELDRMVLDARRPRKWRPFYFKFSVRTSPAIPGPCEEDLKFTLLQLQEKKNKSLQLNVLEFPTIEWNWAHANGWKRLLEWEQSSIPLKAPYQNVNRTWGIAPPLLEDPETSP